MRPLVLTSVGVPAVLVSVAVAVVEVGVEVDEVFETTVVPAGFFPVAVAVLLTVPASTSAWVIVYAAVVVHVVLAPGANVVAGQVVAPTFASTIATPVTVNAPVFVTRKLYETLSPASTRPLALLSTGADADLTRLNVAALDVVVAVDAAFDVTVDPAGLRPVTVAVLLTEPASTSACVIAYGAVVVQVVLAPGASVVAGQVVAPTLASTTATVVIVWAPVLVTRKL